MSFRKSAFFPSKAMKPPIVDEEESFPIRLEEACRMIHEEDADFFPRDEVETLTQTDTDNHKEAMESIEKKRQEMKCRRGA